MVDGKKLLLLDVLFFYLEMLEMLMYVGSMVIFCLFDDYKGDFFEDFKVMIVLCLYIVLIFKVWLEKVLFDIDYFFWVEDD